MFSEAMSQAGICGLIFLGFKVADHTADGGFKPVVISKFKADVKESDGFCHSEIGAPVSS